MEYRVFNRRTKEDITDKNDWVVTPDGRLSMNIYGDFIGDPDAVCIPKAEVEEYLSGSIESDLSRKGVII